MKTLKQLTEGLFDIDGNVEKAEKQDSVIEIAKIFGWHDFKSASWNGLNDLTLVEPGIPVNVNTFGKSVKDIIGAPLDTITIVEPSDISDPLNTTITAKDYFKSIYITFKWGLTLFSNYHGVDINVEIGQNNLQLWGRITDCNISITGHQSFKRYNTLTLGADGSCKGLLQGTTVNSRTPVYIDINKNRVKKEDFADALGKLYTYYKENPEKTEKVGKKLRPLTKIKFSRKGEWCYAGNTYDGDIPYLTQKEVDNILGVLGCKINAKLQGIHIEFWDEKCNMYIAYEGKNKYECQLDRIDSN